MGIDRAGHADVSRAKVCRGTGKRGGIREGDRHIRAVGTCCNPRSVQAGREGGRAARAKRGDIRNQATTAVGGAQRDIEACRVAQRRRVGRDDRAGVSRDPVREDQVGRVEASGGVAVDIDRERLGGGAGCRNRGGEGVDPGLVRADVRAIEAQAARIRGSLSGQRGGADRSRSVAAVGAGEDKVPRERVVGDRDQEVGRAAGDHGIGSCKNRLCRAEGITGGLEVDRVGSVDQGVAGGDVVGDVEGAGVSGCRRQEGVGCCSKGAWGQVVKVKGASKRGAAGHRQETCGGSTKENIQVASAVDREGADLQGSNGRAVARGQVRAARHGDGTHDAPTATQGSAVHSDGSGAAVGSVHQEGPTRNGCRSGVAVVAGEGRRADTDLGHRAATGDTTADCQGAG